MNVKLIAVDMDGTFLTNNNEYDQERFTRQYEFMKEKGIHFVVASGNQYYQLRSFFPDIHNELAFIAENGAYIVDQGKDVFVAKLAKEDIQTVLKVVNQYPEVEKIVCGRKSAYISKYIDEDFYNTMNFYYHRLAKVDNFDDFDDTIFKIYLHCSKDNFETILTELKEKIGHIMTPVDCGHFGIDLIIPGINKAHGINLLMERWKISDAETMAFGDSGNDLEMLEQATYGFAMANAKEAIKKIADYTISSNEEHGVLEVVDWYISKKRCLNKEDVKINYFFFFCFIFRKKSNNIYDLFNNMRCICYYFILDY